MKKPRRPVYAAGYYYHFYNRGAHRASLFHGRADYLFAVQNLRIYADKFDLTLVAYCLLPNHYHFLVRQNGDKRAGLLPQHTFNSYSKVYNKKYGHQGTLFEGPYRCERIENRRHLRQLCCYIHANPVKHGFVSDPAAWPFSNYLEWIHAEIDPVFMQTIFGELASYQKFMAEYLLKFEE